MRISVFLGLLVVSFFASAQLTFPEQDCIGAIPLCQSVFTQTNSYYGIGQVDDLGETNTCLENWENNSAWYVFEIATPGNIEFTITPLQIGDDYDFALYDLTIHDCSDISNGSAPEVRCNYALTINGGTGLQAGNSDTSAGLGGAPFLAPLTVVTGQRFALMIDNFSSTISGYTVDFSASTATFGNITTTIQSASIINCTVDSSIIVTFSSVIQCNSIAADGSDFMVSGPTGISITGVSAVSCSSQNFTNIVLLRYTGDFTAGQQYSVRIKQGTDGNTLNTFCNSVDTAAFHFVADDDPNDATIADFNYLVINRKGFFYQQSTLGNEFFWDFGDSSTGIGPILQHTYDSGGTYNVCLVANGYCSSDTICKLIDVGTNTINGKVYLDMYDDCQFAVGNDFPLGQSIIQVHPGPAYAMTNSLGNYSIQVDTGLVTVTQVPPSYEDWPLEQLCPSGSLGHQVVFNASYEDTSGIDFADTSLDCQFLTIKMGADTRRICDPSHTRIECCNEGLTTATNIQVTVVYPEHITMLSADHPYQQGSNPGTYIFNIDTLVHRQCAVIYLADDVACDLSLRDQTQCVEAFVTPMNTCILPDTAWNNANIKVRGVCENGTATLWLFNAGTGDMVDSSTFRLYLDSLQVLTKKFILDAGDSVQIQFEPNGQTVRLEADQVPHHPWNTEVSFTLEACTGDSSVSTGFVLQFPPAHSRYEFAQTCGILRYSFDPNDKQAVPTGLSENHYIPPRTRIDYTIRFQNTGNSEARNVWILDTLSSYLDLSTFRAGVASHRYQLGMIGKGVPVLVFTFSNIDLPDSTSDPAGSQGYVNFSIIPHDTTPLFTRIENEAAILFDLNDPVMTGEVFHIISDTSFIAPQELDSVLVIYLGDVGIREIFKEVAMSLFPNPTTGRLTVTVDYNGHDRVTGKVFDVFGKMVHQEQSHLSGKRMELDLDQLSKGIYIIRLSNEDFTATRKFTLLR